VKSSQSFRAARRLVVLVALSMGGWLDLSEMASTRAASLPGPRPHREVALTYAAHLQPFPPDAKRVQVWIPLAKSWDGQEVLERTVRAPVSYRVTQDPDYGNEILYLAFTPSLNAPLDIQVDYLVRLGGERPIHEESPAEFQRSLGPNRLVIIDDEVRTRAQRATEGRATLRKRARGIYDDVIRRMTYDKTTPGWGRGDTRRACVVGKGNCTDFHSLFISMARAEGIPARFKIGFLIPHGVSGALPGYHCWAEFYGREQGWVPIDASEAWKHPERADDYFGAQDQDRVLFSVGRDLQLVPSQVGERVNIFIYPYVEIDGRVVEGTNTICSLTEQQPKEGAL